MQQIFQEQQNFERFSYHDHHKCRECCYDYSWWVINRTWLLTRAEIFLVGYENIRYLRCRQGGQTLVVVDWSGWVLLLPWGLRGQWYWSWSWYRLWCVHASSSSPSLDSPFPLPIWLANTLWLPSSASTSGLSLLPGSVSFVHSCHMTWAELPFDICGAFCFRLL